MKEWDTNLGSPIIEVHRGGDQKKGKTRGFEKTLPGGVLIERKQQRRRKEGKEGKKKWGGFRGKKKVSFFTLRRARLRDKSGLRSMMGLR